MEVAIDSHSNKELTNSKACFQNGTTRDDGTATGVSLHKLLERLTNTTKPSYTTLSLATEFTGFDMFSEEQV